jgi:hypothetical protein
MFPLWLFHLCVAPQLDPRSAIYKQLPLSSRLNLLPVKLINWSLVLSHEHSACALVELMQIEKTPSGANHVLHHAPEAFNGIEVVSAHSWSWDGWLVRG